MKSNGLFRAMLLSLSITLTALTLTGCIAGVVEDTSGTAVPDVDVTAFANCNGAGCDASRVEIPVRSGTLTGYRTTTNANGQYFYDPYAEVVAPEEAKLLTVPEGSPDGSIKLSYEKSGYEDIWLDFVPQYEEYTAEDGTVYHVAEVPTMHLCLDGEIDTDGDAICDNAELLYGTSPLSADTDGDGMSDYEEVFGSGSPITINTLKILHANVNVSDFEASKSFYMLLGFTPLLEVDVDVTDPAEAAGLNMPPYQLHAAPMGLGDGYVIDLIRWTDPYDPSAPYAAENHLGLAALTFTTTNLAADMAALTAHGIAFSGPVTQDRPVAGSQVITFSDPDGSFIEVVQPGNVATGGTPNSSGETYITGALQSNINVSDYEASRSFYEMLGFEIQEEVVEGGVGSPPYVRSASMTLPDGHNLNLSKWEDPSDSEAPYAALNHIGIARIAIETANLDADIKILEDNGVEFYSGAITPSGPLSFLRYACFEDPDGTVIELVEYN